MIIYALVFVILMLALIVAIEAYWINTLINKLMSRNYYDYVVTKKLPEPEKKKSGTIEGEIEYDHYDEALNILGGRA